MNTPRPKQKTYAKQVAANIYERGTPKNRYFQVRTRLNGEDASVRFPYIENLPARDPKSRERALSDAKAAVAKAKVDRHIYEKSGEQVYAEQRLRDWLLSYRIQALLRQGEGGTTLAHLVERKAGQGDAAQVLNMIKICDAHASEFNARNPRNPIQSVMDKKITELNYFDFADPNHGLFFILTGKAPKRKDPKVPEKKPPATAATKRRALALLNSMWSHAKQEWQFDKEEKLLKPWRDVKIEASEKKMVTRALTLDELEKVELAMSELHPTVLAAIHFLRWTAARSGEMQKLRWENFTWPNATNKLKAPKVKFEGTKIPRKGAYREREIFLSVGAHNAIKTLFVDGRPLKSGIVFKSPSTPSKPLSRSTAYQAFTRAVNRAEVPHARLHDLRHTRTTEYSLTLPAAQAMAITGHTDHRTFMRYTHVSDETVDRMEEADKKRMKKQFVPKTTPFVEKFQADASMESNSAAQMEKADQGLKPDSVTVKIPKAETLSIEEQAKRFRENMNEEERKEFLKGFMGF